ncbi:hypothetical protein [Candidatus Deianiraea vastatrix]|uniref:Uncharacterized protein n=1 Tax=Candidatus Deianiraea vastatrix TaxID=2163644 RepID=A0A5B8XEK8_9RICK|nr:hypothetical protein [Candidatus Deianiraea vastatrix]QED23406.1 hypothetical protein Deia_00612 [Candidatus Deianiraea vastatrix]
MLIKITLKKFLVFLLIFVSIVFLYLYRTNWFFDRKIHKLAKPLLRNVMESGHYRIPKDKECPFDAQQIYLDSQDLMMNFANNKDVKIFAVSLKRCPNTPMRMNGSDKNDLMFNTKEYIPCDQERRYEAYLYEYDVMNKLLQSANFNYYMIYSNKNDCVNYNTYIANLAKWNNIIDINDENFDSKDSVVFWVIKQKGYYYMFIETNSKHGGYNLLEKEERYLIFKKLTLRQLILFDNGFYWDLIRKYKIDID